MSVRLSPEAAADLQDVFGWYSERNHALGLDVIDAAGPVVLGCLHAHHDPQVWHVRSKR